MQSRQDVSCSGCQTAGLRGQLSPSISSSHPEHRPRALPSGLLGIFPAPTLLLPHCCFHVVGGLPAHSPHPFSSPLSPWGEVVHHPNFQPPVSLLARLCRKEGRVWLCAHWQLGPQMCVCRDPGPAPPPAAWCPCIWLPGRRVLVLEPRGLCATLLGDSWCPELAPASVRTGTSSELTPCPRWSMRAVGREVVAGRAVSAPCLYALERRKRG